jgi:hypothetical protein
MMGTWNLIFPKSNFGTSIATLSLATELTPTTTATSLAKLAKIGMVREITGGRYGRLYSYDSYLKILAPSE